jgi:hypothetical protein
VEGVKSVIKLSFILVCGAAGVHAQSLDFNGYEFDWDRMEFVPAVHQDFTIEVLCGSTAATDVSSQLLQAKNSPNATTSIYQKPSAADPLGVLRFAGVPYGVWTVFVNALCGVREYHFERRIRIRPAFLPETKEIVADLREGMFKVVSKRTICCIY